VTRHRELKGGLFGDERLCVCPCTLADAQRLVEAFHRHHGRVAGHKFSLMAYALNAIRSSEEGVAIVGRPVSRHLDDGRTLEVTRLATSGTINVASMLLAAAAREARARGYERLITYTLASESGVSLRAAGFALDGASAGGSWDKPSRPRVDRHPTGPKLRWSRRLKRA
jgi:hypothetical protein